MNKTENVIFTNLCMICDGENILLQDRTDPKWSGLAFPGGHVENGEPFTDAVIREVFEETGLTVSNLQMCGVKDWIRDDGTRYVVFLYKTNTFTGTLKSSDEGNVMWVPLSEIHNMNLARSLHITLDLFLTENLTEHFFYKENDEWIGIVK